MSAEAVAMNRYGNYGGPDTLNATAAALQAMWLRTF